MKRSLSVLLILSVMLSFGALSIPAWAQGTEDAPPLITRASFGVKLKQGEKIGMDVIDVTPGEGAEEAGILPDDLIVRIGETEIKSIEDFKFARDNSKSSVVEVEIVRGNGSIILSMPPENISGMKGKLAYNAVVEDVTPGSSAEKAGIRTGDIILKFDGCRVDLNGLSSALKKILPGDEVELEFLRNYSLHTATVTLDPIDFGIVSVTPITTEVSMGEKAPLITVEAVGNMNKDKAFSWFYNITESIWGSYNTNDDWRQFGLRVENSYDEEHGVYTSTLWADGVNKDTPSVFYCLVSDGISESVKSPEVTITIN